MRPPAILFATLALPAGAQGFLENPQPGSTASGISLISGWHCTGKRIEIAIDNAVPVPAASGTSRADTASACGRSDTGFGYLFNWGLLAEGNHTIRVLADGVEFARADFRVASLGAEYLRGRTATTRVEDFPSAGSSAELRWNENLQGFSLERVVPSAADLPGRWNGANLERRSGCTQPQNEGTRGTYAQYDITMTSESLHVAQTGLTGLTCSYTGTLSTPSQLRSATGNYSCSDGKRGSWRLVDYLSRPTEMQLRLEVKLNTTETCTIDAILGGSRF